MSIFDTLTSVAGSLVSGAGSLVSGTLNSNILGSLGRKIGAAVATALVSKYGIDSGSIESIIGGLAALWTVASSIKAHLPSGGDATAALKDAAVAAAQAAVTAAVPAIVSQLQAATAPAGAAPAATA